jgi:hypothetical protein
VELLAHPVNVVYFSRFIKNDKGHGGIRRAFQILNIIQDYNPEFVSVPQNDFSDEPLNLPVIELGNLKWNDLEFKKIITGGEYFYWSEKFRDYIVWLRSFAHKWAGIITTKLPVDIAFVDEPIFFSPLIDRLNELNIPVIGLAQNIETLVRGQVDQRYQHVLFQKEIEYFKKCDLVITISHEDTVLLNNFGVNTLLLPYYPTKEQKKMFLNIRKGRAGNQDKKDYIMLGTAHNIPTLEGMIDFVGQWAASDKLKEVTLYVAGHGTEKIGELLGDSITENIKILGGLDDETLHALLKHVQASIIFQTNSTGALTRIMELLMAGVPVYANHHAARSYHNVEGVIEYHDFSDLVNSLTEDKATDRVIKIPIPEPPNNKFLLRAIERIITGRFNKRPKDNCRTIQDPVKSIMELEKEIAELNNQILAYKEEMGLMSICIEQIYKSKSWLITAPLRNLKMYFMKMRFILK